MKWEGLNLHLENLLPGIVTLVLLIGLLPQSATNSLLNSALLELLQNEIISGIAFIACSYLVGVMVVVLSRFLLDHLSNRFSRPFMLQALSRRNLLKGKNRKQINREYAKRIQTALAGSNVEVKKEVIKRREGARLVRAGIIPVILAVILLAGSQTLWLKLILAMLTFVAVLFLYSYVEVTIYDESLMVESLDKPTS